MEDAQTARPPLADGAKRREDAKGRAAEQARERSHCRGREDAIERIDVGKGEDAADGRIPKMEGHTSEWVGCTAGAASAAALVTALRRIVVLCGSGIDEQLVSHLVERLLGNRVARDEEPFEFWLAVGSKFLMLPVGCFMLWFASDMFWR